MILSRRALLPVLAAIPFRRQSPPEIVPLPPKPRKTRILLGGDVMLSRHVARLARAAHDPASPLRDLAPVLRSADIAFVNLEAPFSDRGRLMEHGMIFKAEPEMIAALQTAGVDHRLHRQQPRARLRRLRRGIYSRLAEPAWHPGRRFRAHRRRRA